MAISVFDLFKIGIGPSSSHTVGPMRAAYQFVVDLQTKRLFDSAARILVELYGPLALTGKGHGRDKANLPGLAGQTPEEIDQDAVPGLLKSIQDRKRISLLGMREVTFVEAADLLAHFDEVLERHSNGMRFTAFDGGGTALASNVFYSVGGGFTLREEHAGGNQIDPAEVQVRFLFSSVRDLLILGRRHSLSSAGSARRANCPAACA